MKIFNDHPLLRLLFIFSYIISVAYLLISQPWSWINIFIILFFLYLIYIVLVKSDIIKDKNAEGINNMRFDLLNIAFTVAVVVDILKTIIC